MMVNTPGSGPENRQFGAENDPLFSWWLANGFRESLFSNKIKRGNCVRLCTSPCHWKISQGGLSRLTFSSQKNSPANRCATIPGFNGGTHGSSPPSNGSSPRCSQGAPKAAGVPWTAGFSCVFFFSGNSPRKYGYTAIHDIVIIDDNLTKIEMMFSTRSLTKIIYFLGELIWFTVPRYTHFLFGL